MAELLTMPAPVAVTIPDARERADALDITRSFIVEAPAGSGKTGLLIQRYLKLLACDNVTDPGQVLAITFTRKATAEMQERVLAQLTAVRDGVPPRKAFDLETRPLAEAVLARDAALNWHLIDSPRSLRIRTIDSVSTEIARGLPVLSGSGGGQSPAEDAGALHAEAAHRTLMLLGGADQALSRALETLLLHRDGNLADCQALIARMLATRDQWGELIPLAADQLTDDYLENNVLPKLEKALDQAICRALTQLNRVMPPTILQKLCSLAEEMAHLEGYNGNSSPISICSGRNLPPQEKAAHLEHWHSLVHLLLTRDNKFRAEKGGVKTNTVMFMIEGTHRGELIQIINQLRDNEAVHEALCGIRSLPPAHYPPEQWHVTKALFRVLSRALVELQFVFAARSECDFAEVGLLARAALRRDSALDDLRTAAGMTLQHLLVDEMQDTSSAQYELIQLLTQRWDGHSQTVFLVGDPKQSIYLFRQARVERFVRTLGNEKLGDVPLTALHLTANFRSQRALVEAFNDDFAQLFPATPDPLKAELVPFLHADAMRPASTKTTDAATARVWHAEALPYADDADQRTELRIAKSRQHAALVRDVVTGWNAQKPGATLAVLVRNRAHLLDIVKAFKAAQIPYRAVEIEPLAERQEILDLLSLTRALLHPADRTAWLALLRTPWCGLSLVDLHTLAGQDDPALAQTNLIDLIQLRGDLVSADGITRLQPFWTVLQAALAQRGAMSLTTLVERTWRAFAAPRVLAPEALTNANHYFELLSTLEAEPGTLSLETLKLRLARLYAAPATHPEAVDLMTIHKSKGLEWDVVFVPALEKTGRINSGQLLSWLEIDAGEADDVAHGIVAPIQSRGKASTELIAWMRSIENARESAERKRLFYVACTRAREELHLFAAPALSSKGELIPRNGSLLHSAWPAAEAHVTPPPTATVLPFPQPFVLDRLAAQSGDAHDPALDAPGTVRRTRTVGRVPQVLLPTTSQPAQPSLVPRFTRPEGSFAARSFGNAMHAFLDQLAKRLANGQPAASLLAELPAWSPRIAAVLRSNGLPAQSLQRFAGNLQRGLAGTLRDPQGIWLLSPHPEASSESSLTTPEGTLRLDRTFLAGPEPGSQGTTHLWIADYKTATHAQAGVELFLADEKRKYKPQLETYAQALAHRNKPIRLALYYPMLPSLLWWEP